MATTLPPPSKRQRTAVADRAREQQELDTIPADLGSIRVQFVDQGTGKAHGAAVSIPVADATVKNLELLLNTLQQNNDPAERVPYRFTYQAKVSKASEFDNVLDISSDIYHSLLKTGVTTTEESISLQYTPQAIFKVRAVSRCSSSIPGHNEAILATSFSPSSSSRLVTGSGDATARIWDADTGTPLYTLKDGHKSWVLVVSWSPDDSSIATGSMDNNVQLWDPKTGEANGSPLTGHKKWITALAWEPFHVQIPGRPRIASSSKDTTVRIYDVTSRRIETVLSGHQGSVSCVRWGGTGNIYTSSHDKTVKVWNSNGSLINTLSSHAHWVNHLALSTDFVLRTAYHDHTNQIPPTHEGKVTKAKERFQNAATSNGQILESLVSASDDFTIYLWNPSISTKPVARLTGHQKQVNHVTFSPDGALIASAGWDNHVKLWSREGKFITTLRGHVGPVYMTCFSPDSRLLVSGSKDTTLKVWDVRNRKLKEDLPGHQDEVYAVDWSPDGQKVGSGGKDKTVRIWRH